MGEVEAGYPTGFGHVHLVTSIVTPRRADDAHLGDNCGRPRQFNGIVDQVGELKAQTVVPLVAPGSCEDRRCVSSHVENNRWRDRSRVAPAVFTITASLSSSVGVGVGVGGASCTP